MTRPARSRGESAASFAEREREYREEGQAQCDREREDARLARQNPALYIETVRGIRALQARAMSLWEGFTEREQDRIPSADRLDVHNFAERGIGRRQRMVLRYLRIDGGWVYADEVCDSLSLPSTSSASEALRGLLRLRLVERELEPKKGRRGRRKALWRAKT